jgi:hypothetical protein
LKGRKGKAVVTKSLDISAASGFRGRIKNLGSKVRSWVAALASPGLRVSSEERELMLEEREILTQDAFSPERKKASLLAGAEQMLSDGHARKTVVGIYGEPITREAESRLEASLRTH